MRHRLHLRLLVAFGATFALGACAKAPAAPKSAGSVSFATLKDGDTVKSPLEVCIDAQGLVVEPAGEVKPGHGHHHILVDVPLPGLDAPIGKDEQHIHMGDGSRCHTLELSPGEHTLRLLFADGMHVPYDPPITAQVVVKVAAGE
ncbi:MAG: DUF4399 domain-containing protein [Deltaproteobacteria bacterium]|nr:DUF4399 domain-containing protein [Deltaproteobacteria bacterium]MCB9785203.1 DUF4399 domain-containing protein [Deltaproteobacteria bacterium]